MFDRFTDNAKAALSAGRKAAQEMGNEFIGTQHVLQGLCQPLTTAGEVLVHWSVDARTVSGVISKIVRSGTKTVGGQLPFTPRTKKALELAMEEAARLGHNYIGTGHLLLGILGENEGIAVQVLANLGINIDSLRDAVLDKMGSGEVGSKTVGRRRLGPTDLDTLLAMFKRAGIQYAQDADATTKMGGANATMAVVCEQNGRCDTVVAVPGTGSLDSVMCNYVSWFIFDKTGTLMAMEPGEARLE